MKSRLEARIGDHRYPIVVGLDVESEFVALVKNAGAAKVALVTDDVVGKAHGARVLATLAGAGVAAELFTFPSGERNKNQETASKLQEQLLQKKFGRDALVIALGGGVVGDVAGYVASTFLRGVPYIQAPTTLLAMVDSSIGGKVGVDTPYGKNTVGAFWQPRAVISDMRFLETLPKEQFVSGLLEAVKDFLTADKEALAIVEKLSLEKPLETPDILQEIITRAAAFKAGVVERDEREQNERRILNFGHTIGHAIEFLSNYTMPHGFAVGHGILVEAKASELLGILSPSAYAEVAAYLSKFGVEPDGLKKLDIDQAIETTKGDKKARGGSVYYVLLKEIGAVYMEGGQYAHPVEDNVIERAYRSVISS